MLPQCLGCHECSVKEALIFNLCNTLLNQHCTQISVALGKRCALPHQPATATHSDGISVPACGRPCCKPQHLAHLGQADLIDLLYGTEAPSSAALGNGAAGSAAHIQQPLMHSHIQVCVGSLDTSRPRAGNREIWAQVLAESAGSLGFVSGFHPKKAGSQTWLYPEGCAALGRAKRGAGDGGA